METTIFMVLCGLAGGFLVYFMVQIHKELLGSKTKDVHSRQMSYSAEAAVLQMRFAVAHDERRAANGRAAAGRMGKEREIVQAELPDLGPIPMMSGSAKR